jgi:hypothetical protein
MWVFLFFLLGVTSGMEQAHFKDQMSRYLFQQHRTIEKLRPVFKKNIDHGHSRQLYVETKKQIEELFFKIDNILTLYEISDNEV